MNQTTYEDIFEGGGGAFDAPPSSFFAVAFF